MRCHWQPRIAQPETMTSHQPVDAHPQTAPSRWRRLRVAANQPRDIAALAAFRVLFGLLLCVGTLRFVTLGWVERLYVEPSFHFKYWGFGWVVVPERWALYTLFAGIAVSALCIALGLFYRVAVIAFVVLFSYAELMDVTTYLNHHYLVILLAFILCWLSPHRAWSLDAWRRPALRASSLPAWQTWWLRFQVGLLYFYAGWAKFESDWLLHAQPLNIWLPPLEGMPLIGWLLDEVWIHYAFSWFAFVFDVSIIGFMLWRRTRPWAFALIVLFHVLTHLFFSIGLFPFIMVLSVLVFFDADWPRRLLGRLRGGQVGSAAAAGGPRTATTPLRSSMAWCLLGFCLLQFLLPLRHWIYPGTVLWHEQGMRFSWRVMLREKSGSLAYRVVDRQGGVQVVSPYDYLTEMQYREMAGQPDMILQLAHRIRDDFNARGIGPVQVFADSWVSLNARPAQRMIRPDADLAQVRDGLGVADWITPAPTTAPRTHPRLRLVAPRGQPVDADG